MTRFHAMNCSARAISLMFGCTLAGLAHGAAAPSGLMSLLEGASDGAWIKASLNTFVSAAPDVSLRNQGYGYDWPAGVLVAWSSVAWDSKRGDILAWGGGHANYGGNEMYRWNGTSRLWELASLPSKLVAYPATNLGGSVYVAVDGEMNAPSSAHTYDNNDYLAIADRFITLGGSAFNIGATLQKPLSDGTFQPTGPYLFDPSKADATKVGGTTGSGVDPSMLGGNMWQNRDQSGDLFKLSTWKGNLTISPMDGTSAVTTENGHDVVYFTGAASNWNALIRYEIVDVLQPELDRVSVIGSTTSLIPYGSAGLDATRGFYVTLSLDNSNPFVAWDIHQQSGINNEGIRLSVVGGEAFDGAYIGGIDWDQRSGDFMIWTGAGEVWRLSAPGSGVITDSWSLQLENDGTALRASDLPDGVAASGVRGKWKYADGLGAFVAVEGNASGDVWLYRPEGWSQSVGAVPEPQTWLLWAAGLAGIGGWRKLRAKRA